MEVNVLVIKMGLRRVQLRQVRISRLFNGCSNVNHKDVRSVNTVIIVFVICKKTIKYSNILLYIFYGRNFLSKGNLAVSQR